MAIIEVKVPQLSESVAEATLLEWHKSVGEAVQRDENLIDIETDKVVLELPAPDSGVLVSIIRNNGDTVVADELIATIDTEATAGATPPAAAPAPAAAQPAPAQAAPGTQSVPAPAPPPGKGVAMPAAGKLMAENNLGAGQVEGTGRDGRITKGDVLRTMSSGAAQAPSTKDIPTGEPTSSLPQAKAPIDIQSLLEGRPEQRVPMSRLRQRVAERLLQSQATNAILTTFNEVNMEPVMTMRKKYRDQFEKENGTKLGFMSFFVKAAVHALKKYPVVNASIDGKDIVYHGFFDVGVAVGSPRGLVVPVVRNADQMTFAQIEQTIGDFGTRAQEGKLTLEELTGGTFSLSNGGVFGSMLSTPIINPPQSAILGIHATKERAVVENGEIVIRPINYLALSYDHRIIDGREAVLFLVAIKDALEDPSRLLLDL
jgi:2-oxoglutarate dehydrogenase E2 component (dihydrolipoamide succinyltransferase)